MTVLINNANFLNGSMGSRYNQKNPLIAYHSVITTNNLSVSNSDTNGPALNMWNPDTASRWIGGNTFSAEIFIDQDQNYEVDYVAIAGHNFGSRGYSVSVFVGTTEVASLDSSNGLVDDSPIIIHFDATTQSSIYVRITGDGSSPERPYISHIKLGKLFVLQRRIFVGHTPPITDMVKRISYSSENGQYLGQIITSRYNKSKCQQNNITKDHFYNEVVPFINHINGLSDVEGSAPHTFMYAWRGAETGKEVLYGWVNGSVSYSNSLSNGMMEYSFDMSAVS